ncbi:PD-(D/E)XK motif protein [Dyadobacter arcticus]|nr:PD-(D/E)XK motif protein [Dyadobacter arcticus]
MHPDSQRRLNNTLHEIFCIKDTQSRYGIKICYPNTNAFDRSIIKIQGITVVTKRSDNKTELHILLNSIGNLDIFSILCIDIIETISQCKSESNLLHKVFGRLHRWQRFLAKNSALILSKERQMGLFSELMILRDYLIPSIGIRAALECWTGPDFDKKDFSTHRSFIEVKSLISSKGSNIMISSLTQLDAEVKPLWLAVYYISENSIGESISDVASTLLEKIGDDSQSERLLLDKLSDYGYLFGPPEIPLFQWLVDRVSFYSVVDSFPKILAKNIAYQISDVIYRIDLSNCRDFETDFAKITL